MRAHTEPTLPVPVQIGHLSGAELAESILQLDDRMRLVLTLHRIEGLSLEQIAAVLDEPEAEVAALFYWAYVGIGACPSPQTAALCA